MAHALTCAWRRILDLVPTPRRRAIAHARDRGMAASVLTPTRVSSLFAVPPRAEMSKRARSPDGRDGLPRRMTVTDAHQGGRIQVREEMDRAPLATEMPGPARVRHQMGGPGTRADPGSQASRRAHIPVS